MHVVTVHICKQSVQLLYQCVCLHYLLTFSWIFDLIGATILRWMGRPLWQNPAVTLVWYGLGEAPRVCRDSLTPPSMAPPPPPPPPPPLPPLTFKKKLCSHQPTAATPRNCTLPRVRDQAGGGVLGARVLEGKVNVRIKVGSANLILQIKRPGEHVRVLELCNLCLSHLTFA